METQEELYKVQQELIKLRELKRNQYELEDHENFELNADQDRIQSLCGDEYDDYQPNEDIQTIEEAKSLESPTDETIDLRHENSKLLGLLKQQIKINSELDRMLKLEKAEKWRQNERLWRLNEEVRQLKQRILEFEDPSPQRIDI